MGDVTLVELTKSLSAGFKVSEENGSKFIEALGTAIRSSLGASKAVVLPNFGVLTAGPASGEADLAPAVATAIGEPDAARARKMIEAVLDAVRKEILGG
ncbi:MAG TPA: hypothetical protein VEJ18_18685, partial [Planctomycetota bacterium]|nr:hypothetical protein [Planctomycetota bacterium]